MKKQRKKICSFLIRFKYYWGLTSEVYGDFLTLKIKAGHGQGHLVILTIQYDVLMFAKIYFSHGKSLIWEIESNNQVICSHLQQFCFLVIDKMEVYDFSFLE